MHFRTLCILLLAVLCLGQRVMGQFTYTSQSRSVGATSSFGSQSASAPDFGPFAAVASSGNTFIGFNSASHSSTLRPDSMSFLGFTSKNLPGTATSTWTIGFSVSGSVTVQLSGSLKNAPVSLAGPSVNLSIGANETFSRYVVLTTGGYTLTGGSSDTGSYDVSLVVIPSFGTAFTYQGKLTDSSGAPVVGPVDLRARLFDAATGGTQQGGDLLVPSLSPVDGLFTTTLDFGVHAATTSDRYLELAFAAPGSGTFTALSPRNQLRAAFAAVSADRAHFAVQALAVNAASTSALNDYELRFRTATDGNHGVGYFGGSTSFRTTGFSPDGPVLFGFSGGGLGTVGSSPAVALRWNSAGLVSIGGPISTANYRLELPNTASPAGQGRANAWVTYSSRELKENIQPLADALGTVCRLRGVSFDWKQTNEDGSHTRDVGFIAEEVGAVLPELVTRTPDGKATGLDYGRVVPLAIEAIKQQQAQIQELRDEAAKRDAESSRREAETAELKARLERLERLLGELGHR